MRSNRVWGDGVGANRQHCAGEVDMHSAMPDQYIECVPCGVRVEVGGFLNLGYAWIKHGGKIVPVPYIERMATDSEVEEFLKRVEDPAYESDMSGGLYVTQPGCDLTDAFYLLERLLDERAAWLGGTS